MDKIEKFKEWWDKSYEKIEGYRVYLYYDDTCPDLHLSYDDKENDVTVYTSDDWGIVCVCGLTYADIEPVLYSEEFKPEIRKEIIEKKIELAKKATSEYIVLSKKEQELIMEMLAAIEEKSPWHAKPDERSISLEQMYCNLIKKMITNFHDESK